MSSKLFRKEELQGKTVVFSSGVVGGVVEDVAFGLDGTLILIVKAPDGKELRVPMGNVLGAAEFVVVREGAQPAPSGAGGANACKFCGTQMSPGTVYCPNCGKSQV